MNTTTQLSARGLSRHHGGRKVLRDVDLDLAAGEYVAIMGPSGSGKSTLLYALSGMDRPDAGSVVLSGTDLTALREQDLARLRLTRFGFVFQQIHLLRHLTLLDNVVMPALMARRGTRPEVLARARELMERCGVGELAERDITQASGGQLQRVGVCRALINDPQVLFADEPTGALDSTSARSVMRLLDSVATEGTTLVLVTHDLEVAARADRVLMMADGEITGELLLGRRAGGEEQELAARVERIRQDCHRSSAAAMD